MTEWLVDSGASSAEIIVNVVDDGDDSGASSDETIVNVVDDGFINVLAFIKFGSCEDHLSLFKVTFVNIKLPNLWIFTIFWSFS